MFVLNNEGGNVLQLFFIEDWYRILAPIFFLVLLGLKVILLLFKEGRNWSREKWALKSDWDLRHQSSLDKGKDNVWDLSHLALSIQQFTAGQPFSLFLYPHQGHFCIAFRQRRGVGRERERERNIHVREKYQLVAFSYAPWPGIKPTTWVCVLSGHWTSDLLVYGWCSNHCHCTACFFKASRREESPSKTDIALLSKAVTST